MVEHLVCNQAVVGSNPVASTTPDSTERWEASSRAITELNGVPIRQSERNRLDAAGA